MPSVSIGVRGVKTADFDFELPPERIAQRPAEPREGARLLVVDAPLADRAVGDLPGLLAPGSLVIVNDTKVIPAQLEGRRGEAKVSLTLHKAEAGGEWRAFARPAKRLRAGDRIDFGPDFAAEVVARGEGGEVRLRFDADPAAFRAALDRHGRMPLPPYIKRQGGADARDSDDYQTMFAAREGAVAAPTAGLHFTPRLIAACEAAGVEVAALTLHVGAGTFLPVTAEDVRDHRMHAEYGEIGSELADRVNAAKSQGRPVVAIGTTVMRLLESAAVADGRLAPFAADTDIFITPGFRFRIVDRLVTNFHLPRSTLFMLVCAFAGTERMRAAYAHAIANGYRFFSYGDASLLTRAADGTGGAPNVG
jgi:S-adenosylmethionine:tRNA ribosyltransferase-isomerase